MSLQFVSFTSETTYPPSRVAHAGSQPAWHSRVKDFVFLCPGSHNQHSLRKHVYAALTESSSS
ncbi:hypothetical protein M405DRAFT_823101 [Rhizopogon salebrosus TDB-379]|nr:hypothetical protein M405DRAFT_823101 [Rhizopogon salebrosus TDB-379]